VQYNIIFINSREGDIERGDRERTDKEKGERDR
jgi:hypothetical protein